MHTSRAPWQLRTCALILALASSSFAYAKPTVAVLNFEAQYGVQAALGTVLSDFFAQAIRQANAYDRVASMRDVEAALGIERLKQMAAGGASIFMARPRGGQ